MSIKQNFPTVEPTLNLDFASSRAVDSRITFTRASAATYTDALGVLQTVRNNKPRIDFDATTGECRGLLIEEQRTNLAPILQSWTKYSADIFVNAGISPSGMYDAVKVFSSNASNGFSFLNYSSTQASSTFTVYAKAAEYSRLGISSRSSDSKSAIFDLVNGTVVSTTNGAGTVASTSIKSVGNGWYRCSVSSSGTTNQWNIHPIPASVSNSAVIIGTDNITYTVSSGILVWGHQWEVAEFATSYVPSTPAFTSRTTSATYFDSTGVLRIAPVNGARYGYGYDSTTNKWISQGLVVEPAATNLIPTSSLSSFNTGQNMDIIQSIAVAAVDGSIGGVYKLTPDTTNNAHSVYRNFASSTPSTRCVSVYLKAAGYNYARIYCDGNSPTVGGIVYDLSTGTTSIHSSYVGANRAAYGMENVGNGWYRCWLSGTATNADWYFHIDVANTAAFTSFAGDGSSGVYAWGPQMEIGLVPTSYIPTSGAAVTRAADTVSAPATTRASETAVITGTNFSNWYNGTQGTLYAEQQVTNVVAGGNQNMVAASLYKNTSNFMAVGHGVGDGGGTGQRSIAWVENNTTQVFSIAGSFISSGLSLKNAFAYQTNNFAYSANTQALVTDSTGTPPLVDTLTIGYYSPSATTYYANGHIKKIAYYPVRLSNTQLQALTV